MEEIAEERSEPVRLVEAPAMADETSLVIEFRIDEGAPVTSLTIELGRPVACEIIPPTTDVISLICAYMSS